MNQQNLMQMISAFNNFRRGMTNDGARQQVQELIRSGQISQQELNQLQRDASDFCKLLR